MALARVVTFEDIDSERIAALKSEIEDGEKPEGLPATEMMILHDQEGEQAPSRSSSSTTRTTTGRATSSSARCPPRTRRAGERQ